jgi:hypothetical protein
MPSAIMGGGGQSNPSTFSQGGNPAPYIPTGQGNADQSLQNLLGAVYGPSFSALSGMTQLPATQAWPQVQQQAGMLYDNPYASMAQGTAGQVGSDLTQVGNDNSVLGQMFKSQVPGMMQAGQDVYNRLIPAGNQVWDAANDPQQALYSQLLGQNQAAATAQNAQSGLAGTPYGAGLLNDATRNFGMQWQNNQLGRQMQGLQGLESANTQGLGAMMSADQGAGQMGQLGANLQNKGLGQYLQGGQLPYQTSIGQAQTGLGGLNQMITLGDQQFQIPMELMQMLQGYLNTGQNASRLALEGGHQGFNQQQTGLGNIGGLLGLGGSLLSNFIPGGGLLSGLSGLFGGGGGGGTYPGDWGA